MLEDIGHIIDAQQFGSRKGSSTTYCLLDLIHSWLSALDEPEKYLRACVLDFSKAFDRVKLWSSQLWEQFLQLRREAWKMQDFNGVWTRDLAIPVRRSNQLSYEATDVGSWSFVGSNGPVRRS